MSNDITLTDITGVALTLEARDNIERLIQALIDDGDLAPFSDEEIHLVIGATLAGAARPIAEKAWYEGWEAGISDADTIGAGVVSANPYNPEDGE